MPDAWKTLKITGTLDPRPGIGLFEEPLFYNDFLVNTMFSSSTFRTKFVEAGIIKLGQPAVGEWREEWKKTPVLGNFSSCGKKLLYQSCVKVLNLRSLAEVKVSRWNEFFTSDSNLKDRWRVLNKPSVEKWVADLQWRIIHGAIATNRHRALLDPSTGDGCPFCAQSETLSRGI